jgi:hypothetical protein
MLKNPNYTGSMLCSEGTRRNTVGFLTTEHHTEPHFCVSEILASFIFLASVKEVGKGESIGCFAPVAIFLKVCSATETETTLVQVTSTETVFFHCSYASCFLPCTCLVAVKEFT